MKLYQLIVLAAMLIPLMAKAQGNGRGHGKSGQARCDQSCGTVVSVAGTTTISEAEAQHLLYLREEEKLARDVYLVLGKRYAQRVFVNIPRAEQRHMDAVLGLLELYGLPDPVKPEQGRFKDPKLQKLYDALIARGQKSQQEAFLVGALIEEVDILDLQAAIRSTENKTIRSVLEALLGGSKRHLNAFVRNYESSSGKSYTAQKLPPAEVASILGRSVGNPRR